MPDLSRALVDPDHQPPMPFQAADDYACTVMAWAQEPLPDDVVVTTGLVYGPDRLQRYDVFAPPGARDAPVLVFWHGGGWTNGYRDYNRFMAQHVTRLGMLLIAPSYRLAPAHKLPAALDDCLAVLKALVGSLAGLGGAPDRLILGGHSAGGHLAALTTLRTDARRRAGLPEQAVRACLPISAIMDLYHPAPPLGSLEERVYTTVLRDAAEDAVMSPLCWTVGTRVPMLLSWGERDSDRVRRSNTRLLALLKAQDCAVQSRIEAGSDHFQTHMNLRDAGHPWYRMLQRAVEETGARA